MSRLYVAARAGDVDAKTTLNLIALANTIGGELRPMTPHEAKADRVIQTDACATDHLLAVERTRHVRAARAEPMASDW
jgi:hypothetical protein